MIRVVTILRGGLATKVTSVIKLEFSVYILSNFAKLKNKNHFSCLFEK